MACIARRCARDSACAWRYAAPWARKMSATSTAGLRLARGTPLGAHAAGIDYARPSGLGRSRGERVPTSRPNRLVSLTAPDVVASFQYDAVGRRIRKTLSGTTTTVLHDGVNPTQEATGAVVRNLLTGLGTDEWLGYASDSA